MSFTVITAAEKLPGPGALTDVLAAVFKLDRPTAAMRAHRCMGIIGRDMDEASAGELAARCAESGIKTFTLPSPVPALPAAELIKTASLENGVFSFSCSGNSGSAGPGGISVISAAPIKEDFLKITKTTEGPSGGQRALRLGLMAVTGLPIGLGKTKEVKKEVKGSELAFYMDLMVSCNSRRLRVASGDFDFSCLKEKKTCSSQVNFRLLAAELAAFAPGALKNTGLLAMLEGRPLSQLPYDTLSDLENETLRLVLAAGLK